MVVEQRERPGGRAYRLEDAGYTWDTGPSLITMPWVLEETFAAGGLDMHAELTMRRLDPLYRIRWAGRTGTLRLRGRSRGAARARRRSSPITTPRAVGGFLDALEPIYEEGILAAGRRAFGAPAAFAALMPAMLRLGAIVPLHRFVAGHFEHPRVREAFSFHSLFIGGDPLRVPAIYGALVSLQVADGGWYADGGVYSVVEAMARPLDVRCGEPVEAIEHAGGRVTGVRLAGGERIAADAVISNADVLRTHELVGRRAPLRPLRPTMSCFLLYLGTDRVFEKLLLHHTLLVGPAIASSSAASRAAASCRHLLDLRARARAHRAGDGARRAATRSPCCCRSRICAPASTGSARPTGCATRWSPTWSAPSGWRGWTPRSRWSTGWRRRTSPRARARSTATRSRSSRRCTSRPTSACPTAIGGLGGLYHVGGGTHPGRGHPGRADGRRGHSRPGRR